MDTKTLYDWAAEAGLNFSDDDGHHDAVAVWVKGILEDSETIADFWLDALTDKYHFLGSYKAPENQPIVEKRDRLFKQVAEFHEDLERLGSRGIYTNERLISCYATSIAYHATQVGESIALALIEWVTAYVEKNADEWWKDCIGYHSDMMEGQREDWAYEQYKDRQLEDRE